MKKELIKAARAVAATKTKPSVHVAKEYHARNRMEMEHWIKRKNALRAKAIMREKKHSNFILENDVVRLAMASVPSKKNVAKLKKLTKKQKKSLSRAK